MSHSYYHRHLRRFRSPSPYRRNLGDRYLRRTVKRELHRLSVEEVNDPDYNLFVHRVHSDWF